MAVQFAGYAISFPNHFTEPLALSYMYLILFELMF